MKKPLWISAGALAGPVVACVLAAEATAQSPEPPALKHPVVVAPASLTGARAESVYQAIREQIRANYAAFGDPVVLGYQEWKRFNKAPYRSRNHGERFVNHYGNDAARGYGKFEDLDPLPAGAIIIKDSFTVTRSGAVMTGPLFMMEKMQAGFSAASGDWRFLMLRPDGELVGMTGGERSNRVAFCAECHRNAEEGHDYLFFMPPQARIRAAP